MSEACCSGSQCGEHGKLVTVVGVFGVILVWFGINQVASGQYVALNIALLFVRPTQTQPPNTKPSALALLWQFGPARLPVPFSSCAVFAVVLHAGVQARR